MRRAAIRPSLPIRDPDDPAWKSVELVQRGRMILDVATADLEAAEAAFGAFHPTAWYFRNALAETRRSWERLRADYGTRALDDALSQPPLTTLTLGDGSPGRPIMTLVPIAGRTYCVERVEGTSLAPVQFRLTRLPPLTDGPYYACRLHDGTAQCDCAEWTYQVADQGAPALCKHLAALAALGWI